MELLTLGGLTLSGVGFVRVKPLLLLTYVVLEGRKDRRHLAELFWPQATNPLNSLSVALKQLKHHVPDAFRSTSTHVASDVICDAQTFLQISDADHDQRALEIYRGPFLQGVFLHGWSVELEEWIYSTREVLAARARRALLAASEIQAADGHFGMAAKYAEQAYLLPGASPMEPGELRSVYTLLAAGNSPLVGRIKRDALDFGVAFSMSSEEAKRRFQAKADLTTSPNSAVTHTRGVAANPNRLPIPATSFVGRDLEMSHIENLLLRPDCRLLTLTGTGGIGKTRLALQLAEKLNARYRNGVCYAPLDALHSEESIPQKLAEALNLSLSNIDLPFRQVIRYLTNKHMLLVFDNYEHLLDGALLMAELLQGCPEVRLLVTSRERLDLEEEWVLPLAGLMYPKESVSIQKALEYGAVNLLTDRIRKVNPGFPFTERELPLLLKLCQLVGGLPLALELAAVWLRALSLEQLTLALETNLDILRTTSRNVAERHRSIRATFDGSWNLLSLKETQVLRRLSVFRGGFHNEAAAYVASASLATLIALADKSLLAVQTNGRYHFHPLLQQYFREKLTEQKDEETHVYARYKDFYLALVSETEPLLYGPTQAKALKHMQEEQDNIRELFKIAETSGDLEFGLQLASKLRNSWLSQGYIREGFAYLIQLIKHARLEGANVPTSLLAESLEAAAWLAEYQEKFAEATSLYKESAQLYQGLGKTGEAAGKLVVEAMEARAFGNYRLATALLHECLTRHRLENNCQNIKQDGIGMSLTRLGLILCEQGSYENATALYEESLALHRSLSDDHGIAITLLGMSDISREKRDAASLYTLCTESLRLFQWLNEMWGVGYSLNNLALGAYIEGNLDRAAKLADEGVALFRTRWSQASYAEVLSTAGWVALAQDEIQKSRQAFTQSLTAGWDRAPRWLLAVNLEGIAGVAMSEQDPHIAVQLLGVARTLRKSIGIPLSPLRQSIVEPLETEALSSLSPEEWSHANAIGQNLPLDLSLLPLNKNGGRS